MENNQKFEQPLSLTQQPPLLKPLTTQMTRAAVVLTEVEEKRKCHTRYQKGGANKGVVATGMKLSSRSTPDSQGESRVKTEPGQQARLEFQREFSRVQSEGRRGFFEAGAVHSYIYPCLLVCVCTYTHAHTDVCLCIYDLTDKDVIFFSIIFVLGTVYTKLVRARMGELIVYSCCLF